MDKSVDPDEDHASASYSVPPVVRAIKVLRHIAAGGSTVNHSQAAREIGINRTTLLRLLHTLEAEGFIERGQDSENYALGTGIIELAARKIFSLDIAQVAHPILGRLAEQLGLSSHLGILEEREVLYVLRFAPNVQLVSNVTVGTRMPAHASALGRVILAHMDRSEVARRYRDVELAAVTDKTPTRFEDLARDLDAIRAAGVADSRSGFEIGIDSIAAPVFDHGGRIAGAINASGPDRVFAGPRKRREDIAAAVRNAARDISKRLGFIGPGAAGTRPQSLVGRPHAANGR